MSNLFVIVGPSGVGKTSITEPILRDPEARAIRPPSFTTRDPRAGEVDGYDYHFIDSQQMAHMWRQQLFVAYSDVYGQQYGTLRDDVLIPLSKGYKVVLIMNPDGCDQILLAGLGPVVVGVLPPSMEALQARLVSRGASQMESRMVAAEKEIGYALKATYQIVNADLGKSISRLREIMTL